MRAYLAARFDRKEEVNGYAQTLEKLGVKVISRWHKPGLHGEEVDVRDEANQDILQQYALEDLDDLFFSDTLIFFTEPDTTKYNRGGRHVEFGYAVALAKRIILVGQIENVFHYLPDVERFETVEEFTTYLDLNSEVYA